MRAEVNRQKSIVNAAYSSKTKSMGSKLDLKTFREKHHQFYLVIYSETDADHGRYQCGSGLDLGLSEQGMENARKLARRFKRNPLKIKKIFASPELRAIQMADFLHDEMKGKLTLCREFMDQNLGELEGKPVTSKEAPFEIVQEPMRGERGDAFSLRVREGLERILKEDLLLVLVTHPRVASLIFDWLGLPSEELIRGKMYAIDIPEGQGIAHYREV